MKHKQIQRALDSQLACLRVNERDKQHIMMRVREGQRARRKLSAALVLAFVLVFLTVTAVAVTLLHKLTFADREDVGMPLGMAIMEDTVYYVTWNEVCAWRPEWETAQVIASGEALDVVMGETALFHRNGELMLLDERGKGIWRVQDGTLVLEESLPAEAAFSSCAAVWQDGALYLLHVPDGQPNHVSTLCRIRDGAVEALPAEGLYELAGYRDGKLLALQVDGRLEKLVVVDLAAGEVCETLTAVERNGIEGLAYNGEIYAMVSGRLSRWENGAWQTVYQHSIPGLSHSYGLLEDGYVAAGTEGIQFIPLETDGEEERTTLTIRGFLSMDITLDHDYQQEHANISVVREKMTHLCAEEVRQAILAGDETDLFHLMLDSGFAELMESGLIAPLESEKLAEQAAQMAPPFRGLAERDGTLYGVILDTSITVWQGTEDVRTMEEALAARLPVGSPEACVRFLLKQHIMECGEDVSFDTPAFRRTMEASRKADWSAETASTVVQSIFSMSNSDMTPFDAPLRIDAASEPRAPARVHIFVLNPNSRHKEEAIAFLEYAVSRQDAASRAILSPEAAAPQLAPTVQEWIDGVIQDQRAFDQERGAEMDEAALAERVEAIRSMPGNQLVAQEKLAAYRQKLYPHLDFQLHPLLSAHSLVFPQMEAAVMAYAGGEMTLDELIGMLDELAQI